MCTPNGPYRPFVLPLSLHGPSAYFVTKSPAHIAAGQCLAFMSFFPAAALDISFPNCEYPTTKPIAQLFLLKSFYLSPVPTGLLIHFVSRPSNPVVQNIPRPDLNRKLFSTPKFHVSPGPGFRYTMSPLEPNEQQKELTQKPRKNKKM
eukprot:g1841.t1